MKKVIMVSSMFFLGIIIFIWIHNVVDVNNRYEDNKTDDRLVGIGETLEFDNISFTVTNAQIYDIEAYVNKYSDYPWLESERTYLASMQREDSDLKILCYNLKVDTGDEIQDTFSILQSNMSSDSGLWNNIYCYTLLYLMNDEADFEIDLNDSTEITVPVCLFEFHFTDDEWNRLDESDLGLRLTIQQQPELCAIEFDEVEHIRATEEEKLYFDELMKKVEEIENTSYDGMTVIEDNIGENGVGIMEAVQIEMKYIKEVQYDEIKDADYHVELGWDYLNGFENIKYYEICYNVTNIADETMAYMANMSAVAIMVDGELINKAGVVGVKNPPNVGTKQDYTYVISPGESVEIQALCHTGWPDDPDEISKMIYNAHSYKENYYLVYNPTSQNITSLANKMALFIALEDFWR